MKLTLYNNEKNSYIYALLDPRILPISPFYIGIGHDRKIDEVDVSKKYSRPYNGHFLLKTIEFIKRHNTNNSSKLNKIVSIKKKKLEIIVFILKENLTSKEAKSLEIKYISRFGRKGIDKNGTLTNVMPGGDGHDKMSCIFCRQNNPNSDRWDTDWKKDEEKVKLWKQHLSESARLDESLTHRRAQHAYRVGKTIWKNKEFADRKSKNVSEINRKNWKDPNYRNRMRCILKETANTEKRKQVSANNLRKTVNHLWKTSESFRKDVSERTRRKALCNNADPLIMKRQQTFRLISMYYNKYKKYPWLDMEFNQKKNPTLLSKLYSLYIEDNDWLKQRINKLGETMKSVELFLSERGEYETC